MEPKAPVNPNYIPAAPEKNGRTWVKTALWLMLMLLSALVLCHVTILKITTVTVVGNVEVPREEVIRLAGLNRPVSALNIRESAVREGIDSHIRLTYEKMEHRGLNHLVIYVTEQRAVAGMTVQEGQFILDEDGLVLEKTDTDYLNGLTLLTGLQFKRITVGEKVTPVNREQLDAYTAVMREMRLQGCDEVFAEFNVTHLDHLYLISRDGYVIDLGNKEDMRAKLFTLRGVLKTVREDNYKVGSIDCTVPGYAVYSPPDL